MTNVNHVQTVKPNNTSIIRKVFNFKIGIMPFGVYLALLVLVLLLSGQGNMPTDMLGAIPIMFLLGFGLAELGNRMPILKNIGGGTILAMLVPAYMVAKDFMVVGTETVTTFMRGTNFLYVFIAVLVVGSIFGMNRVVLIKGFTRMFVPLLVGTIAACIAGVGVGSLLGLGAERTFFYIVIPIMAGGMGEGAIPLSIAYAEILGMSQTELLGQIVPAIMLGSTAAVILVGLLSKWGEKRTEYSGNGMLVKTGDDDILRYSKESELKIDFKLMGAGIAAVFGFYLIGTLIGDLVGLPGPIVMIIAAAAFKIFGLVPKSLENGAYMVYKFFATVVVFPLLAAVGIVYISWADFVTVLNPAYLITVLATVVAMVAAGFFVGKYLNMYPIESAIVTACHSGMGGTGDIAILTASNRMGLMPFAQISTRIGGALTVTLAVILMRFLN